MNNYIPFFKYFSECFIPYQQIILPIKEMHREVCETLQKVVLGELPQYPYVNINVAPRIGKTLIACALVSWQLAYFPDSQIIYTSVSAPLAEKSTRMIKAVMESQWYKVLFPWVELGGIQKANEFDTVFSGKVYGAGANGTIIGFGAGLKRKAGGFIIIDDASNPNESLSAVEAAKLHFWFENTILRRRNSSEFTPIIQIAQRLAPNDLSGYMEENYRDETLILKYPVLVNGESIIPETISTKAALKTKEVNPFVFWAQLQQEPIVLGGNLIKTDDFFLYVPEDMENVQWDAKILTADTALEAKEHNDNSVVQCWGKLANKAYLIDMIYGKWESPQLAENYEKFYHKHHRDESPITKATVEKKASGHGLIQQLKTKGIPIVGIERTKDKVTRVQDILAYIVTHMVGLPKDAPFMPALLSECAQFRADGKHPRDDMVDALADGVWNTLGKPLSIFEVMGNTDNLLTAQTI